jgi:excisionase family DNA binding protein
MTMNENRWLSVQDIAAYLGVKNETIYVWIAKKRMPAHKVGRLWKFKTAEVDTWVRSGRASAKSGRTKTGRAQRGK